MTTSTDDSLTPERHEVQRLLGQCLLRLQGYELLMKAIVAHHRISTPFGAFEVTHSDRLAETSRKTLGILVGDMIGSFLVREGEQGMAEAREDAHDFALQFQVILPPKDFARTETDLRDLLALRNNLVHHFLEQHDLRTIDGCLKAQGSLRQALDRVAQAYEDLKGWAEDLEISRKGLAESLATAEIRDFITEGRVPWTMTQIARALNQAAMELAPGGWARVEAAVRWINAQYPDERPDGYGCKTWRQVIHESKLFDIESRKIDGRRQAWYRPRDRHPSPS